MIQVIQMGQGNPVILDKDDDKVTNIDIKQQKERAERNNLLAQSDMNVLEDIGLSESKVAEWKSYRQSLRDMDFTDPDKLTWPTKPSE